MRPHGQSNRKQAVYRSQTTPASKCASSASSSVSSTIAKSFKSIPWPSTTSQLSLHGHQGCSPPSPVLQSWSVEGAFPWPCLFEPLTVSSVSPSPPAAFSAPEVFLFIIVRWSLNATSSGSLSCLLPTYVVTLCGKTRPNGTKGAQTIAICLQTQLPQPAITSQTMWTGSQARHPVRQAHKCQCHLIQKDAFSGPSRSAEKHRGEHRHEVSDRSVSLTCRAVKGGFL